MGPREFGGIEFEATEMEADGLAKALTIAEASGNAAPPAKTPAGRFSFPCSTPEEFVSWVNFLGYVAEEGVKVTFCLNGGMIEIGILAEIFGESYVEYCAQVNRFLPTRSAAGGKL